MPSTSVKNHRIPEHHARTVEDVMAIVGGYRRFAEKIGFLCVFRGQTRDYFNKVGLLLVLPGILRELGLYRRYRGNDYRFRDMVNAWFRVLREFEIETCSGVEVDGTLHLGTDRMIAGRIGVNHPVAILRADPVVAAILQHYGFLTDHLDATTDAEVALWFALHESRTVRRRISFPPLPARAWVRRERSPSVG